MKNSNSSGAKVSNQSTQDSEASLKRAITLKDATLFVIGSMIGSGIFIVSADIARHVGSPGWLMVIWAVAGLMTITAALSYGELSGMFPHAGGQYVYLKEAYNPLVGFLYGWSSFTVIQSGLIAAVAMAFTKFAAYLFPGIGEVEIFNLFDFFKLSAGQLLAIFLIVALTYLHTKGVKAGKAVQTIVTSAKLLSLFAMILLGFINFDGSVWDANWTDAWKLRKIGTDSQVEDYLSLSAAVGAIAAAMVGSIFASDAWNSVTFIAGEIRNPSRNIGLSLFLGTLTVTIIYLLTNVMYTAVLSITDIAHAENDRVAVAAARSFLGDTGGVVIAVMIMVSTLGCNNGLILAGARLYYTMAHDGLFFKKAKTLNRHAVPAYGLWTQCAMACVLCLSGKYGDLLDMISFVVVIFYILTILAVFILRAKQPDIARPYKAFGYPWIPALYVMLGTAFCVLLMIYKPGFTWPGLVVVLLGLPIYYIMLIMNDLSKENERSPAQ